MCSLKKLKRMDDFIRAGFFIMLPILIWVWYFVWMWMNSRERIQTEHGKFIEYMKKLRIDKGEEILMQFNNPDELIKANERLKKCVK